MPKIVRTSFEPAPGSSDVVRAASLALAIMRKLKLDSWSELNGVLPYTIELLPGQLDLLREHLLEISWLARCDGKDAVTIAHCPQCSAVSLCEKTAPANCAMTLGCPGKPVRVTAAPRVQD